MRRINQVLHYGWKHSRQIADIKGKSLLGRLVIFLDIIYCFTHYKMWSNQYLQERFWELDKSKRDELGAIYRQNGIHRDSWQKDFQKTKKFLIKYSNIRYEKARLRDLRTKAYTKYYNAGEGLLVEHNVLIYRQHYLNGSISIGKNVLLAKNSFIDYSGEIIIKDNVRITNGVIIETHHHPFHSNYRLSKDAVPSHLIIEDGAVIGSRAIILSSCHRIGKYARVGAGSVVTHDIPDFAIAIGAPAHVIKLMDNRHDLSE
ncbi:MAG: acyltransferase [Bacteroidales bacterium]|nr:acyltransferase [Bacteroidales bacterium]